MMYVNKDRRLGFVKISFSMLAMEQETLRAAFVEMQFVPLYIETKLHEDIVEYYGTSPKFRPVLEGEKIPLYMINIKRSDEKLSYTFEFEEVRS